MAAPPAFAQDAVDPIGALLDQAPAMDEDQAEAMGALPPPPPAPLPYAPPPTAAPAYPYAPVTPPASTASYPSRGPVPYTPGPVPYTPRPVAPYNPAPTTYAPQTYSRPAAPKLSAPVHVDEYDKTPEAPLNAVELGYESRLRSSFASAQGMQGPMDGAWVLRTRSGETLYSFLLVDKGGGTLEGAWRDPRRRGSPDASGFLVDIQRVGSQVTASFYPRPGAGVATLMLNPVSGGEWSGDLLEGRDRTAVTLRRN